MQQDYLTTNLKSWNDSVDIHVKSDFYFVDAFRKGKTSLNSIELELLGDVTGKKILHLQCHFGQDTLSLERLGGITTGVDFSDKAIDTANALKQELGLKSKFIVSDVYSLPEHLVGQFDVVFTTYGVLGWLPDMKRWAAVVSKCLKRGGKLILVEFHPVVWIFDNAFTRVQYSYFNRETIVETEQGTYADPAANITKTTMTWNHPLSDVIGGLLENGLAVNDFKEYDYAPYNCLQNMVEVSPGRFQIKTMEGKMPLLYSIVATKS